MKSGIMINLEEALSIVLRSFFETHSETVPFNDTYGRVLDEDVFSDSDIPPFNRSAMDGFACRKADLGMELEIIEVIPAGYNPVKTPGPGQCVKIMTGAVVPDGCEMVFMVEESEMTGKNKVRFTGTEAKLNLTLKGEDVKLGDVVLSKGKQILPQDIAIMASVGKTQVQVKKRPEIAIISTGSELVTPFEKPGLSKIRNSNAYQLYSQIIRAGGDPVDYGIAPDNEERTLDIIKKAVGLSDIVILTGGVSMGDFDFVPAVLQKLGVKILFDTINVQPGKPTAFGIHPKALIFGLPGNPVSSFVQFEILVRPLISRMMNHTWSPVTVKLKMATDYSRKSSSRLGFIPVRIIYNEASPVEFHGSAHLTALSHADGLISMEPGVLSLKKGETVNVRQI